MSLEGLGLSDTPLACSAAGGALAYAREHQMCDLTHIRSISTYRDSQYMVLDSTTLRNLEVIRSWRDGTTRGTLLDVLDHTRTAMGGRLLKKWIQHPLMDVLALIPDVEAVRSSGVSYADYRALMASRPGAAQPSGWVELATLENSDDEADRTAAGLWWATLRGLVGGPAEIPVAVQSREMETSVGFGFFDLDRGAVFGHIPHHGEILVGDFDESAIART